MSNKSAARLRQALRTVEYLHEQAPDLDIHIQVRDPKLAGGSTPALLLEGDALYEHGWSTKPRERVPVELSEDPLAIAAEMAADARELAGVSPIETAMRVLAAPGYHSVKITGTSPSGVRSVVEGGAAKPARVSQRARGGCGQLWYVQQWMQQHPDHARPTVGRSLPIVHAPRLIPEVSCSKQ